MEEKGSLEIAEEQVWRELDDSADQAEKVIKEYGDALFGRKKCQEMINAVRARNLAALKVLSEGVSFPYRSAIRQVLKLLKPTHPEKKS